MADEWVIEQVLTAVEQVPPGRVVAYGDLAAIVGTSPRRVGAIMRSHGSFVTWWRVTNASGDLPAHLRERAFEHWRDEGIVVKPNRLGCRIDAHRADFEALRADLAAALEDRAPATGE